MVVQLVDYQGYLKLTSGRNLPLAFYRVPISAWYYCICLSTTLHSIVLVTIDVIIDTHGFMTVKEDVTSHSIMMHL